MIDTLHIWLPSEKIGKIDINIFSQNLQGIEEIRSEFGEYKLRGRLKNLNVLLTQTGISIKGSLPKFYQGNNLKDLTIEEIKLALQKIENDLSISLYKAKITRIDIGFNLAMKYEPKFYFTGLGEKSQMHRSMINSTSLYYTNTIKTLNLYDKNKEFYKTSRIPSSFNLQKNLLRYELRLNKKIGSFFGRKEILVSDLTKKEFYKELVSIWAKNYFQIKKNNLVEFKPSLISAIKDYVDYLTFIGIDEIRGKIPRDIQLLKSINAFSNKEYYSRLLARLKEIELNEKLSQESEFNKELDSKILEILKKWIVD
ncbi:MAG: phage/plasmid replication domain-containing protein [Mongoliitalea sp.]